MEEVKITGATTPIESNGQAVANTQVGNQPLTVSGIDKVQGGQIPGNVIEPDVDEELFKFKPDDTPLMQLMLATNAKPVKSPEVKHWSIDEEGSMVTVDSVSGNDITLQNGDKMKVHAYDTLSVVGVNGYTYSTSSGSIVHTESNRPLMLFVVKVNSDTSFTVKALNGVKTSEADEYGVLPTSTSPAASNTNVIAAGTQLILLGNAMYETQKIVDPDIILPQPEMIYLQKRGTNSVISDYYDSQKKGVDLKSATIVEAALKKFKLKGNRTLWIGQQSKFAVAGKNGDLQYVYTTKGVRWQFKREFEHTGRWSYEDFITLAKLFYTCEDIPSGCIALCGKDFLENIQCINWGDHDEVRVTVDTNKLGWKVTTITTVFGDFQFKHEPTLDRLGYSSCAGLFGVGQLVHYQRKTESSFSEKVQDEEATRKGTIVWDALALKGSCHIWVDGKGGDTNSDATVFIPWSDDTAPASPVTNAVYCFSESLTLGSGTSAISVAPGEMCKYNGSSWERYYGTVIAL